MLSEWLKDTLGLDVSNNLALVVALILVAVFSQIWWYKHRDRSLMSALLIGLALYAAFLGLIALGVSSWPSFRATLQPGQIVYVWYGSIALVFVLLNVVWWRFLQWLKQSPGAH